MLNDIARCQGTDSELCMLCTRKTAVKSDAVYWWIGAAEQGGECDNYRPDGGKNATD